MTKLWEIHSPLVVLCLWCNEREPANCVDWSTTSYRSRRRRLSKAKVSYAERTLCETHNVFSSGVIEIRRTPYMASHRVRFSRERLAPRREQQQQLRRGVRRSVIGYLLPRTLRKHAWTTNVSDGPANDNNTWRRRRQQQQVPRIRVDGGETTTTNIGKSDDDDDYENADRGKRVIQRLEYRERTVGRARATADTRTTTTTTITSRITYVPRS